MIHSFMMILLSVAVLFSQEPEKKEAAKKPADIQKVQPPSADAPLPKIDIPEFVITGSEMINLNVDSKTENDHERIFSPERPTPGERTVSVGEALTPKQIKSFTKTPGSLNGKVFSGYGFYASPQLDGWFGQYDPTNSFVVNGYYSESVGHVSNADYWRGGFGARGSYALQDSSATESLGQMSGEFKYGRDAYRAFASRSPQRVRDLSGYEFAGVFSSRYALPYKSITGLDYTASSGVSGFSATDSTLSTETEYFLTGNASAQFLETAVRASAEYRASGYAMTVPGIQSAQWFVFRAGGKQQLLPTLEVSYTIQQYFYRGNTGASSGRFYPNIELRYSLTNDLSMYLGIVPAVERNTLARFLKQNRYLTIDCAIMPSDIGTNYAMGMEFSPLDDITATVRAAYKKTDNFATFYDKDSAKVWEVLYLSGVRSIKLDISAVYRLNQKQNVTAYVSAQSVKQADSSAVMPHYPGLIIGSVYHHFFDIGLHTEFFIEYNSSRFTDFSNTHSNAGYVLSGVKAEIELFTEFRGYAELNNIINQQYFIWNGYRERSVYLLLGISYNW